MADDGMEARARKYRARRGIGHAWMWSDVLGFVDEELAAQAVRLMAESMISVGVPATHTLIASERAAVIRASKAEARIAELDESLATARDNLTRLEQERDMFKGWAAARWNKWQEADARADALAKKLERANDLLERCGPFVAYATTHAVQDRDDRERADKLKSEVRAALAETEDET